MAKMDKVSDLGMRQKPGAKDVWMASPFQRGAGVFMARITPGGERLFYFRYSDSTGKRPFLPIGPYHAKGDGEATFTVQQASDKARDLSALYRSGITDLREHFAQVEADQKQAQELERQRIARQQRELREAEETAEQDRQRRLTVRQLFSRWRDTDLQPRTRADGKRIGRKDGGQFVADQFERHVFPRIGDTTLQDLRKADLMAVLDAQTAAGKLRTANVLLADLKQMLDFAAERDLIPGNPIATLKKSKVGGADTERERTLSEDEIRQLHGAMPSARLSPRSAAAVWLILATGVRAGELAGAVWADGLPTAPQARAARLAQLHEMAEAEGSKLGIVDMDSRTWYLVDTKNQRDHTIHLSKFALSQFDALTNLREVQTDDPDDRLTPWVFPATDNRRPVCIKSFGKQLADRQRQPEDRLSNRTKATTALALSGGKWTAHDLRRTAATLMARLGFGVDTINECLNHKQADRMAKVYIRDRREEDQKRAFDALGTRLEELTSQATPSNVVPIKAA